MSYAIDILLSKGAIRLAAEQLKAINEKVKEKQPDHEWLEKNDRCIKELTELYYFLVFVDKERTETNRENFNQYKLILEKQREIDELKKQLNEVKDLL
jgi:hypothetical protein